MRLLTGVLPASQMTVQPQFGEHPHQQPHGAGDDVGAPTGTSWPDPSADSVRNGAERSSPGREPAAPPALIPLEELQRLLDAGGGDREGTAPATPEAATDIPVMATPFPTIGALRNLSVTPGR